MRRRKNISEAGSVYIEAAISLPIVLGLLLGVIEYSNLMTQRAIVSDANRSAARLMAAQGLPANDAASRENYISQVDNLIKNELALYDIKQESVTIVPSLESKTINGESKWYLDLSTQVRVNCLTCAKFTGINLYSFNISTNSRVLVEQSG